MAVSLKRNSVIAVTEDNEGIIKDEVVAWMDTSEPELVFKSELDNVDVDDNDNESDDYDDESDDKEDESDDNEDESDGMDSSKSKEKGEGKSETSGDETQMA